MKKHVDGRCTSRSFSIPKEKMIHGLGKINAGKMTWLVPLCFLDGDERFFDRNTRNEKKKGIRLQTYDVSLDIVL